MILPLSPTLLSASRGRVSSQVVALCFHEMGGPDCKLCDSQDIMEFLAHSRGVRNTGGIELGFKSRFYSFILEELIYDSKFKREQKGMLCNSPSHSFPPHELPGSSPLRQTAFPVS